MIQLPEHKLLPFIFFAGAKKARTRSVHLKSLANRIHLGNLWGPAGPLWKKPNASAGLCICKRCLEESTLRSSWRNRWSTDIAQKLPQPRWCQPESMHHGYYHRASQHIPAFRNQRCRVTWTAAFVGEPDEALAQRTPRPAAESSQSELQSEPDLRPSAAWQNAPSSIVIHSLIKQVSSSLQHLLSLSFLHYSKNLQASFNRKISYISRTFSKYQ